jgi:hypothetical protein
MIKKTVKIELMIIFDYTSENSKKYNDVHFRLYFRKQQKT